MKPQYYLLLNFNSNHQLTTAGFLWLNVEHLKVTKFAFNSFGSQVIDMTKIQNFKINRRAKQDSHCHAITPIVGHRYT